MQRERSSQAEYKVKDKSFSNARCVEDEATRIVEAIHEIAKTLLCVLLLHKSKQLGHRYQHR